ncbi:MAG: hypothetical protein EZS28_003665, partial [Streblomastix strix]
MLLLVITSIISCQASPRRRAKLRKFL